MVLNEEAFDDDVVLADVVTQDNDTSDNLNLDTTVYKVEYELGSHTNWSRYTADSKQEAVKAVSEYIKSNFPTRHFKVTNVEVFDEEAYEKEQAELEKQESLNEAYHKDDKVVLHYDDLVIDHVVSRGNSTGYYDSSIGGYSPDDDVVEQKTIEYDYEVSREKVKSVLWDDILSISDELADELDDNSSSEDIENFLENNFDKFFEKYEAEILAAFEEDARKQAEQEDADNRFLYGESLSEHFEDNERTYQNIVDSLEEMVRIINTALRWPEDRWTKESVKELHHNLTDVLYMIDNETYDLNESVTPVAFIEEGPEIGMASVINSLIVDEYEAIEGYNSAIVTAQAEGFDDAARVLTEIQAEENIHVGQLIEVMKLFDPNADKVEDGKEEGSEQLSNPLATEGQLDNE